MELLLDWLIHRYPTAKRQTLKRMLEEGRVTVNGQPVRRLKQPLAEGDVVRVGDRPEPQRASIQPLKIIHEDADLLVVVKPAGLLTSTVARERRATAISIIRNYLRDREPRARAGIIHRLDRDASGLLVFSKNHDSFEHLKRQFFEHSVERVYVAVVRGTPAPPAGRIESLLFELPDGSVRSTRDPAKGQLAVTHYRTAGRAGKDCVLEVRLETGRKHQIRAHLSERGLPIVGDTVYGGAHADQLMLAAVKLAFNHPRTGQRLSFEVPPPRAIGRIRDAAEKPASPARPRGKKGADQP